jgi:hypothetical protein
MFVGIFSLTPALSRWERGNLFQSIGLIDVRNCLWAFRFTEAKNGCSFSQREKVRMRENAVNKNGNPA